MNGHPHYEQPQHNHSKQWLTSIAGRNDEFILDWGFENSPSAEAHLTQTLQQINELSRSLFQSSQGQKRDVYPTISKQTLPSIGTFHLPIAVAIDTKVAGSLAFNKAFLLKNTAFGDKSFFDSVLLTSAVIFYNTALFFHRRMEESDAEHKYQVVDANIVSRYYLAANQMLTNYMERTRRPLWTLQAAIWYNIVECARFQNRQPTSCIFFEQLEAMVGYVTDCEERVFFANAITAMRMLQVCAANASAA